jgi:hypothetical protein
MTSLGGHQDDFESLVNVDGSMNSLSGQVLATSIPGFPRQGS